MKWARNALRTESTAGALRLRVISGLARSRFVCGAIAIVAGVWGVFRPVLGFEFLGWDDDIAITNNPLLTMPWSWSLVHQFFSGDGTLRFKPVHWLLVRGWRELFEFDARAWHALGLALHAIAAVLVFAVMRKVLARVFGVENRVRIDAAAWGAAMLWAVHPLRVEPVAWVTASTYPLATIFVLSSFWFYLDAYERAAGTGRTRRLVGAWLLAVFAFGSYPTSVTYGLWLIAIDFGVLRNVPGRWSDFHAVSTRLWWSKHVSFLLPAALALGVTVTTRLFAPGAFTHAPDLVSTPFTTRGLMALASLGWFPAKFFWPGALTPNHQPIEGDVWADAAIVGGAMGAVAIFACLFFLRARARTTVWVCLGFVGLSLPCLGLTEYPAWPVNRYSYLLDVVFVAAVAAGWVALFDRDRANRFLTTAAAAGGALVVGLGAYSSVQLLPIWRDSDRLFMHMEGDDQTVRSPALRAHLYMLWARDASRKDFAKATALRLNQAQHAYMAAIISALKTGKFREAVDLADRLGRDIGMSSVMRRERAGWLARIGRTGEARVELMKLLEAFPGDGRARELLEEIQGGGGLAPAHRD